MSDVRVDVQDGVAVATIDRPQRMNACRRATYEALLEVSSRLANEPGWRALVLTGAGRAFCAGQDLDEVSSGPVAAAEIDRVIGLLQNITRRLMNAGKPVVAAINGPAVGFGVECTLACDLRIASEAAWFRLPELRHGLFHTNGTYYLLPRLAGAGLAADMILTGRRVEAAEALRVGLVSRVVQPDQLLPAAIEAASALAQLDADALRFAREGLRRSSAMDLEAALAFEADACRRLLGRDRGGT